MDLNTLRTQFDADMLEARRRIEAFPWRDQGAYALYMKQTEYFTSHSPTILNLVAQRFPPGHIMHERFSAHTREETGHDSLATRDVRNLGYDPEELPVLSITKSFIHAQYHWLETVSPYSLFGWILLLESCAAEIAPGILPDLIDEYGNDGTKFLRLHAALDPYHTDEAWETIEQLSEEEFGQIWENYRQSVDNYLMIFDDIELGLALQTATSIPNRSRYWSLDRTLASA